MLSSLCPAMVVPNYIFNTNEIIKFNYAETLSAMKKTKVFTKTTCKEETGDEDTPKLQSIINDITDIF
jgi:hypothetical protein